MERKILVAYNLGFIDASKKDMPRSDRLILLDQMLIKFNLPPLTPEEKKEFFDEFVTEIDSTLMLSGINRKKVRNIVFDRFKT